MPWVRYDDRYRLHRKLRPLNDRRWRLATEAIMWSASEENLTDGRIERDDLTDIRPKATVADAAELVRRGIWHNAGDACDSEDCPPATEGTGWRIHDYFGFQPSKEQVVKERKGKADRQRRWRESRRTSNASPNASWDALRDGGSNASRNGAGDAAPSPPRPAPPRRAGGDSVPAAPAARRNAAEPAGGGERKNHDRRGPPCPACGNATDSAYHRNVCAKIERRVP